MKYETIKTFILVILVCTSLFLSFVLWSYQPNYDALSDPDYVNEVDIGGSEKMKTDLIEPDNIVFHTDEGVHGFERPQDRRLFYNNVTTWILYDQSVKEYDGLPEADQYAEFIFPDKLPIQVIETILTFNEQIELPSWSFDRIYVTTNDDSQSLTFTIPSTDDRVALTAIVEKSERYFTIMDFLTENKSLQEFIAFEEAKTPIYIPKDPNDITEKTLVATMTAPEELINALFPNPSIVTHNLKEAYFTDGQRGMKTDKDKRNMDFINPLAPNFERMDAMELFSHSITHINEHKGWTNDFVFDKMDRSSNSVSYRMYYEGYPIFTGIGNSVIEQSWEENELNEYKRPLIRIGNILSSHNVELPTAEEIITYLSRSSHYDVAHVEDIKVGYMLRHLQDGRSLILEPKWYILYDGAWKQLNIIDEENNLSSMGGA